MRVNHKNLTIVVGFIYNLILILAGALLTDFNFYPEGSYFEMANRMLPIMNIVAGCFMALWVSYQYVKLRRTEDFEYAMGNPRKWLHYIAISLIVNGLACVLILNIIPVFLPFIILLLIVFNVTLTVYFSSKDGIYGPYLIHKSVVYPLTDLESYQIHGENLVLIFVKQIAFLQSVKKLEFAHEGLEHQKLYKILREHEKVS